MTPPPQRRAGRRDGAGGHAGHLHGTHPGYRVVPTGPDGMSVMGGWDAHFSGMAAQQGRGTSGSQGRVPAETPGRCPQPKERQGKVSAMKRRAFGLWKLGNHDLQVRALRAAVREHEGRSTLGRRVLHFQPRQGLQRVILRRHQPHAGVLAQALGSRASLRS